MRSGLNFSAEKPLREIARELKSFKPTMTAEVGAAEEARGLRVINSRYLFGTNRAMTVYSRLPPYMLRIIADTKRHWNTP
jgi:hypothetical protein